MTMDLSGSDWDADFAGDLNNGGREPRPRSSTPHSESSMVRHETPEGTIRGPGQILESRDIFGKSPANTQRCVATRRFRLG